MSKASTFAIVASLPALDGKPGRFVGKSDCGTQFAVLHQVVGEWQFKAGPWTFATWASCAERVVCGDAKAITWPDAQMCLSAGALVFLAGVNNAPSEPASTGGPAAATATAEEPPPASVREPSSLMPAAPIRDHCRISGCGD